MIDSEDIVRELRTLLPGASRGSALGLGMMLGMDVIAAGDATRWLRLGIPHPPLMACLIASLLLLIALLELEHERLRKMRRQKTGR
ncbi:MAG TPA: hypothetical protein VMU59_15570 [Caulobacteraceae bacterium]|nr:hypothetical protein [Caulobacteraceae bacterium]